jgi:redox-sensitive bicupin YhaK (pirin superfamily)
MITPCKSQERHYFVRGDQEAWLTFYPDERVNPSDDFGTLMSLNEDLLPPGVALPRHPGRHGEIVTYVREGAIEVEGRYGRPALLSAGEFRRWSTRSATRCRERNASRTSPARVFRVGLTSPAVEPAPGLEQRRFSAAERRGRLRVVASPNARDGALRLSQDTLVFSALLAPGQHVVRTLSRRRAWLHVVAGAVAVGGVVLTAGDGASFAGEAAVSLTAREETEILLIDLSDPQPTRGAPL